MKPKRQAKVRTSYDRRVDPKRPSMEVEDPHDATGNVLVTRATRDDPLARLHSRRQIDDAQFYAGRAYQSDWEAAERGPRAIDPTKEAVDGGRMPEPITEQQRRAARRLNEVVSALGTDGVSIVHDVLIGRMTVQQVAAKRGRTTRSWEEYFGKRFRACLDELAVVYGLAMAHDLRES